jgi:hypothetical protein
MSGIPASRTIAVLRRDNPSIDIVKRDIYNAAASISRDKRQNKSPSEALIHRLETEKAEGKTYFEWRHDAKGHIAMLFIADTRSVAHLNKHLPIRPTSLVCYCCTFSTSTTTATPSLHYCTVDNYTSNDKMLYHIVEKIENFDPIPRRVRCYGHVLNLIVQVFCIGIEEK